MASIVDTKKRSNQKRESIMISEFVVSRGFLQYAQFNVRLGRIHPELIPEDIKEEDLGILSVYRRWADCVISLPDKTIILEAKIVSRLGALEALEIYKQLYLSSPEYIHRHSIPIELWFIYAVEDPVLNNLARQKGIIPIEYRPAWLPDYLAILRGRERQPPKTLI